MSVQEHTGILVLFEDKEALQELAVQVNRLVQSGWTLVFHHSSADLDLTESIGIQTYRFRDTLQESYQQCSLPQGLKPLAYRLLGVTMRSWSDVVWPASVRAAVNWMEDAICLASDGLADTVTTYMKTYRCLACGHRAHQGAACKSKAGGGKCGCPVECSAAVSNAKHEHRPSGVEAVLNHVLSYTAKTEDDDEPYDPWKALAKMRVEGLRGRVAEEWEWQFVEQELGPCPILGIGNCELAEAVEYGISDADHTGQVAAVLEQGRGSDRWRVDEGDYDQ